MKWLPQEMVVSRSSLVAVMMGKTLSGHALKKARANCVRVQPEPIMLPGGSSTAPGQGLPAAGDLAVPRKTSDEAIVLEGPP